MIQGARPCGFVATTDPTAAKAFYGDQLGLAIVDDSPFAVVFDAGGSALRVTSVAEAVIAPYTVLGWDVPDIAVAVDDLASRGVSFERFDGMEQDDRGIWDAPGGARIAWCKDPEGNVVSLAQHP
jgi:catechol 2,3-dioxygenase-like lactoylglutathione lyase family enzyme